MKKLGKNQRVGLILLGTVALMTGIAYASVPFYRVFCSLTGYGGTTQRIAEAPTPKPLPPAAKDRWITVSFDSNVDSNLPWDFAPDQKTVRVKLGEVTTITYHARNRSDKPIVGEATFNVQPDKSGGYFDKIQCFCFNKQVLKPGESATLPVQFTLDPAMAGDHDSDDVTNITLSYTFFRAKDQSLADAVASNSANGNRRE